MSSDGARSARVVRIVVVALVALGALLRLWNVTRELPLLMRTTIPDDSFYYFGIARHLSLGHPPSIDGVSATNGYHPLWLALLVPIWLIAGHGAVDTPIRVALALGALLDVGASVLLYRACRRFGLGAFASCVALLLFVASPHQVVNATCGLETSLALFLGLALVNAALGPAAAEWSPRLAVDAAIAHPARLGVLAGLALLARTDQLFLVLAVLAPLAWGAWRVHGSTIGRRWLFEVSRAAVLVYLPWLVYSFVTTGTVVQSSGVALSHVHRSMPRVWGYEQVPVGLQVERTVGAIQEAAGFVKDWTGLGLFSLAAMLAAYATVLITAREPLIRRALTASAPLLGSTFVLFFAHTIGRGVFREWYTAPIIAAVCVAAGVLVEFFLTAVRRRALVVATTVALIAVWGFAGRDDWSAKIYVQTPAGTPGANPHEGHSDCGIVSFFTGQGITNLDGIVNQRALEAMTSGRLIDYLAQENFTRVYLTPHYNSPVFLGAHARERLVAVEGGGLRVATPEEKDERIGATAMPVDFASSAGAEYLGDGWLWGWVPAASVGARSELLFYFPIFGPGATLELRLSAAMTNAEGLQPVTASLGDRVVGTLLVKKEPLTFTIPLDAAAKGRNRLVLEYGAPAPRTTERWQPSWWRSDWGQPVLAVELHSLRLTPPAGLEALDFPADDARLECDGCFAPETTASGTWRWTSAHATLRLPAPLPAGTKCRVELSTDVGELTGLTWDGANVGAAPSFEIEADGRRVHELVLDAKTFQAPGDARALGITLRRVALKCR